MPWKIKKIGEGENEITTIEIDKETGNPIFVHDGGDETPVKADQLFTKISDLISNEKKLKDNVKTLQAQFEETKSGLERFAEIDPDKYKEMSETIKNIEGKTLIEAGEVEKLRVQEKEAVTKEWMKKYEKEKNKYDEILKSKENDLLKANSLLHQATVSNFFSHSPIVVGPNKKVLLTPGKMEKIYGKHFNARQDENGNLQVVGFWENGEEIRSSSKTGDIADPNDALWQLIMADEDKDIVLLGDNQSGGGTGEDGQAGGHVSDQKPTTLKGLTERQKIDTIKKYGQDYYNEILTRDLRTDRESLKETMKGYNTK
jgi:hypothetical protein